MKAKSTVKFVGLALIAVGVGIAFQNCSQRKFTSLSSSQIGSSNSQSPGLQAIGPVLNGGEPGITPGSSKTSIQEIAGSCSLDTSGAAYCWGGNRALGNGGVLGSPRGVKVSFPAGVSQFTSIFNAYQSTCAIDSEGAAYCWGSNGGGKLGVGFDSSHVETHNPIPDSLYIGAMPVPPDHILNPTKVKYPNGVGRIVSISIGGAVICSLDSYGSMYCSGITRINDMGQGQFTLSGHDVPIKVQFPVGVKKYTAVTAQGINDACAIGDDANIYCWAGALTQNQIVNAQIENSAPFKMASQSGEGFVALASTAAQTCGLTISGKIYCFITASHFENDRSISVTKENEVQFPTGSVHFTSLSATGGKTCALDSVGNAFCWANNSFDNIPLVAQKVSFPSQVTKFSKITVGQYATCALDSNANEYCLGDNQYGDLGSQILPHCAAGTEGVVIPSHLSADELRVFKINELKKCNIQGLGGPYINMQSSEMLPVDNFL